jgi:hypothetical protein
LGSGAGHHLVAHNYENDLVWGSSSTKAGPANFRPSPSPWGAQIDLIGAPY